MTGTTLSGVLTPCTLLLPIKLNGILTGPIRVHHSCTGNNIFLIIFPAGGLQSVFYILILFLNTLTFSSGMKISELETSMFNGNIVFNTPAISWRTAPDSAPYSCYKFCSYLSVIKKERLQISQPALDPEKSEVHHKLTARQKGALVHRFNFYLFRLKGDDVW